MKRGMIDIETLASTPDAAIISIGLVGFDETGIQYRESFAIQESDWHGEISGSTVKWWMDQEKEAQDFSFRNARPISDERAAERLEAFAREWCRDECWANGPQFDLVILRAWWNRVLKGARFPIHYRTYRDQRTMLTVARQFGINVDMAYVSAGVAHDPGVDAARQAEAIRLAIVGLKTPQLAPANMDLHYKPGQVFPWFPNDKAPEKGAV